MSLPALAIEKKTVTYFAVFLLLFGGIFSYFQLGQLEDPDFTIKTGVIITPYPGATPREVELEVTDRIEKAIQEMPQLDTLYSFSKVGLSIIKVEMKQIYWADALPQVWDEMRKKIDTAEGRSMYSKRLGIVEPVFQNHIISIPAEVQERDPVFPDRHRFSETSAGCGCKRRG